MKGVSDKDAQNDKKIKGNKNDTKKPPQVLHISKKVTNSENLEIFDDDQILQKKIKNENQTIKTQTIEKSINEPKENNSNNKRESFFKTKL